MKFLKKHRHPLSIIALIAMLIIFEVILYVNYRIKLDSYSGCLAAISAFLGIILSTNSITSWGNKQKAEIKDINNRATERLQDKKLELAAEITEAFHKAKQSVITICSPLSTSEEEQKAEDILKEIMKNSNHSKGNPRVIKRGLVFLHRWNNELNNINHLISLKIKARIYFGENLEKCFEEASLFFFNEIWLKISTLLEGTSHININDKPYSRQLWDFYTTKTPIDNIIKRVEEILIPLIRTDSI